MSTNRILYQHHYKKKETVKQALTGPRPVESLRLRTHGPNKVVAKLVQSLFFFLFENGSTGRRQQWQNIKHYLYARLC